MKNKILLSIFVSLLLFLQISYAADPLAEDSGTLDVGNPLTGNVNLPGIVETTTTTTTIPPGGGGVVEGGGGGGVINITKTTTTTTVVTTTTLPETTTTLITTTTPGKKPKPGKLEIPGIPAAQLIGIIVGVIAIITLGVFILVRFQSIKTRELKP